jgi:hypothetical protein
MSNQYDEDEDMDEVEADGAEDDAADVEEPDEGAEVEVRGKEGPAPKKDEDVPEERTVSSRQGLRDEMARQIEEFLSRGGQIKEIDPNVTADPPRKPESEYGSRPI